MRSIIRMNSDRASGPPDHLAKVPDLALTYRIGVNPNFPEQRPGDTIAAYYAAISYMDAQVGVLLDALDRLGLEDRTIVIFMSDHGYHLGEHGGLWHKLSLFDECVRIPLIVAVPGRKPGTSLRLVESVDLYPTLADLCRTAAAAWNSKVRVSNLYWMIPLDRGNRPCSPSSRARENVAARRS